MVVWDFWTINSSSEESPSSRCKSSWLGPPDDACGLYAGTLLDQLGSASGMPCWCRALVFPVFLLNVPPEKLTWLAGNSPNSLGNTSSLSSSHGWFSRQWCTVVFGGGVFGGMMMGRYVILAGFELSYFATYRYKCGWFHPPTSMRVNYFSLGTELMITPPKFNIPKMAIFFQPEKHAFLSETIILGALLHPLVSELRGV